MPAVHTGISAQIRQPAHDCEYHHVALKNRPVSLDVLSNAVRLFLLRDTRLWMEENLGSVGYLWKSWA